MTTKNSMWSSSFWQFVSPLDKDDYRLIYSPGREKRWEFWHLCWLFHGVFVWYSQTASKLIREFLVALLANRFLVIFIEFRFLIHFGVAYRTREVMNTPSLIQCGENCNENKVLKCLKWKFNALAKQMKYDHRSTYRHQQ